MSRVYAIESTPTLVGSVADHRFIADPAELRRWVGAIASGDSARMHRLASMPDWVSAIVADLKGAHGRAFVQVGAEQPPQIHAWAHALNEALGGRGTTFELIEPVAHEPIDQAAALSTLIADMQAGRGLAPS